MVEDVLPHEEHCDACREAEAEADDGCSMPAVEAWGLHGLMGACCCWRLSLVVVRSARTLRPHGAYPPCCHGPAAFPLGNLRHVTTVQANGQPSASQPLSDNA